MRILDVVQGTEAWVNAKLGVPSASRFSNILTPGGKPSSQAEGYMNALIAERFIGSPCVGADTQWMERGTGLEDEARRWYAFTKDVEPRRVGFVMNDEGTAGCSPDALVGEDGLLEIKCPSAAVHVGYLRDDISEKYRPQVQGQLWVTGRRWVDFVSYCPGLPVPLQSVAKRVVRDEEYIEKLAAAVTEFSRLLAAEFDRLNAMVGRKVA